MRSKEIEVYFDEEFDEIVLVQVDGGIVLIPEEQLNLVIGWMKTASVTDVR